MLSPSFPIHMHPVEKRGFRPMEYFSDLKSLGHGIHQSRLTDHRNWRDLATKVLQRNTCHMVHHTFILLHACANSIPRPAVAVTQLVSFPKQHRGSPDDTRGGARQEIDAGCRAHACRRAAVQLWSKWTVHITRQAHLGCSQIEAPHDVYAWCCGAPLVSDCVSPHL